MVRDLLKQVEGNPSTQYRFHQFMSRFWIVNALLIVAVYFAAPAIWSKASILYLALISVYANYSTDHGAMSAADADTDENITDFAKDNQEE